MEATCVNNSDRKKAPRRHTSASYLTCSSPLSCLSLLYSSFWFQPRFFTFFRGENARLFILQHLILLVHHLSPACLFFFILISHSYPNTLFRSLEGLGGERHTLRGIVVVRRSGFSSCLSVLFNLISHCFQTCCAQIRVSQTPKQQGKKWHSGPQTFSEAEKTNEPFLAATCNNQQHLVTVGSNIHLLWLHERLFREGG